MKERPIPGPSEELKAQCNAENQFSNFEHVFRKVMSVPKAEVLKREAKEKHRTNGSERGRKRRAEFSRFGHGSAHVLPLD